MIKEIKKHWKEVLFLILGVPIIFISITYFLFDILPGNKIIEKNDWIGFAGSYLGIIGAVGAVWWQMRKEENDEIKGLLCYIKDILKYNKENYTLEYMDRINNQAASVIWMPNYWKFEVKLKKFEFTRNEVMLLYKHKHDYLIDLEKNIDEVILSYYLSVEQENIFIEIEENIINKKDNDPLLVELKKLTKIIVLISEYFYYNKSSEKEIDLEYLNKLVYKLNKKKLLNSIKEINTERKLLDWLENEMLFSNIRNIEEIKIRYMLYLTLFYKLIFIYDLHIGYIVSKTVSRKLKMLSSHIYKKLIEEISIKLENLNKEL